MTWPACGIETPTPSEIWGSSPIVTNSVVPIAKPPTASARTAGPKRVVVRAGRTSVVVVIVTILQRTGDEDLFLAAAQSEASVSLRVFDGRITSEALSPWGR